MAEESIYNLIPEPEPVVPKGPLYRSMHPKKADARALPGSTFQTVKKPAATMGPAKVKPPKEEPVLRPHAKEPKLPPPSKFEYHDPVERRPPVVKRDEKPVMGLSSSKNFIASNAVEAILAVPKKPATRDVNFLEKPDYGKVPAYLEKVKEQVQREYEYVRALHATETHDGSDGMRLLTDEERLAILEGLKTRWAELNRQYQTLSFTIDTINKRVRKEQYEKELAELEKDIERMSKPKVYVAVQ